MESPLTGSGIPDSEYCFPGGLQGWVEFKKANSNKVPHVRPGQIAWLERRCRYGGRAFVAVRLVVEKQNVSTDRLLLFTGMAARFLLEGILEVPKEFCRGEWSGGPGAWDWESVEKALKTG